MISNELKMKVQGIIDKTVEEIERSYGVKFPQVIEVRYDINSSRLAGQTLSHSFIIRLNPGFLKKYQDDYINRTVVHELAHLGVYLVYRLGQRKKVRSHGYEWKSMMEVLGAVDTSRCHTFEADINQGHTKTKYGYICEKCHNPIPVGAKIHRGIQKGLKYKSTCCRFPLIYHGVLGQVSYEIANDMIKNKITTPIQMIPISIPKAPSPTSKLGKCYKLYIDWHQKYSRKGMIAVFVNEADCTPAGASTYYATCSKLYEQGA
jgi:predicted SprT family Zn-dependent metalloprotease